MNMQAPPNHDASLISALLDGDSAIFQQNFNRVAFQFAHHLGGHPLFELTELLELAKSMPPGDIYYDAGDIQINQRWDKTPPTKLSVDQLIDRIENSGAWILIRRAHRDPRYAALLDQGLREIKKLIGDAYPAKIKKRDALVFITSPNRTTTYHMDRECNYLLQIRGQKVISIFDRYDREVTPEQEIERFWTVDNNAGTYKAQYQNRASRFELKPGTAVHIPVNAPHWVQNDGNISVTLALTFQFPDSALGNIYRTNYYLRKLGLNPLPPGGSRMRDALKGSAMQCARNARDAWKRIRGRKQ